MVFSLLLYSMTKTTTFAAVTSCLYAVFFASTAKSKCRISIQYISFTFIFLHKIKIAQFNYFTDDPLTSNPTAACLALSVCIQRQGWIRIRPYRQHRRKSHQRRHQRMRTMEEAGRGGGAPAARGEVGGVSPPPRLFYGSAVYIVVSVAAARSYYSKRNDCCWAERSGRREGNGTRPAVVCSSRIYSAAAPSLSPPFLDMLDLSLSLRPCTEYMPKALELYRISGWMQAFSMLDG